MLVSRSMELRSFTSWAWFGKKKKKTNISHRSHLKLLFSTLMDASLVYSLLMSLSLSLSLFLFVPVCLCFLCRCLRCGLQYSCTWGKDTPNTQTESHLMPNCIYSSRSTGGELMGTLVPKTKQKNNKDPSQTRQLKFRRSEGGKTEEE